MNLEIEKYKILWDQLNGELNRFWNRFNVLVGIQLALVITLFKPISESKSEIIWGVYIILIVLSIVTLWIVNRAIKTYEFTYLAIQKFEELNLDKGINLITNLTGSINKNDEEKFVDLSSPMAYKIARIIPRITFLIWSGLLFIKIGSLFS